MFAWLNGPGRVFQEPLPSSTNYLGAYDKTGNLLRMRNSGAEDSPEEKQNDKLAEEEDEEGLDEAEKKERRAAREAEAKDAKDGERRLPPERASDLRPFPLNTEFRSQPVLSEELREEVWRQVVELKQSVSTVSAVFGIDMRRVAAVVRLKTVEKDWVAKVCFLPSLISRPIFPLPYDDQPKNRLVFKTSTWLRNLRMRASLITKHLWPLLFR